MITRRNFIKTGSSLLAGAVCRPRLSFGADATANTRLILPSPPQIAWQDCEIGLLYSFDLAIAAGDTTANNAARKRWDPNLYQPRKLDTDQWMEAAKGCGAGYALFTATHFNGFMQWQSDLYPYGLKQTSWRDGKCDVVAAFVASCHKYGIKPGLYFSVNRNVYQQVWDHYADWGKGRGGVAQDKFNRIAERQMAELCSRYGPLLEIWFDAGTKTPAEGGPDMLPIFEEYQPDAVFYSSTERSDHRWIGNEAGQAGDPCWATMPGGPSAISHNAPGWKKFLSNGDPDGAVWSPGMVDVLLRGVKPTHNWFWAPNEDECAQSVDRLIEMYLNSVGRNCNLVIGEVITPDGLVPDSDIKRFGEFGRELKRRWGKPVAETTGTGVIVELKMPAPSRIENVVVMEDTAFGERVQNFTLTGKLPAGGWQELARGQSIGHKRIEVFPSLGVTAVRLQVDKCKAEPRLRKLAAYASA